MTNRCVLFDFDGVVVNSIDLLYELYIAQLRKYGAVGNKEEFESLNGANLREIVDTIIRRHGLSEPENVIYDSYLEGVSALYWNAKLNDGVLELLECLKQRGNVLFLVTGSRHRAVVAACERLGIYDYFSFFITGDDVRKAKPDPALYQLAKSKMPGGKFLAIEDSINGLQSVFSAKNIVSVHYNPTHEHCAACAALATHCIDSFSKIPLILRGLENEVHSLVRLPKHCKLTIRQKELALDCAAHAMVDDVWGRALQENRALFNGRTVGYLAHEFGDAGLSIDAYLSEYKYYFAQKHSKIPLGYRFSSLAISGIIVDEQNNTLIGKRTNVTQYERCLELLPSGGMAGDESGCIIDPSRQLVTEFIEETGLSADVIEEIEPCCLIEDRKDNVIDVGFIIHVHGVLHELLQSKKEFGNLEYESLEVVNTEVLIDECRRNLRKMVPVSYLLLSCVPSWTAFASAKKGDDAAGKPKKTKEQNG